MGCNFATKLKYVFKYDDTIEYVFLLSSSGSLAHKRVDSIFATHAIGGFIGAMCTGLFADSRVTGFDGTEIAGSSSRLLKSGCIC